MKKYFLTLAVMAIFVIGFAASDEEKSSNSESSTEQKQEAKESKPYAKFIGKYVLYDDEGRKSFFHFKVNEKGHFLQSLGITSEYNKFGTIEPVSDDAFCLSLWGNDKINLEQGEESQNYVWANGVRNKYLGPNKVIRFDIKEGKMYPDNEEYNNREYREPTFYKFRFTKQ